jgi:SAM-dependent methyltransferase
MNRSTAAPTAADERRESAARLKKALERAEPHNWLVHKIYVPILYGAARGHARGKLIDIGAADQPWKALFEPFIDEYIGVDHASSLHDISEIDVVGSAYDTTLESDSADTVISTAVWEHLERPLDAAREAHRILRPGGALILTCPLFWHIHEEPRDFYRYTAYGLDYLLTSADFQIVEIRPLSGFIVTFIQEFCYYLVRLSGGRLRRLRWGFSIVSWLLQRFAYYTRRFDLSHEFTWMYLVVARKPE